MIFLILFLIVPNNKSVLQYTKSESIFRQTFKPKHYEKIISTFNLYFGVSDCGFWAANKQKNNK